LSQCCRGDGTKKRRSQPGRRANPADADTHLLPQKLRVRFGLLLSSSSSFTRHRSATHPG
jgi:hypothetical protein